ncbi:MAG: hypothetical protein LBU79_05455 [Planctomycetota bacterium]|jgi:hypothetical protein|nr:hypothetical protein [Planctomycetota bacterium]
MPDEARRRLEMEAALKQIRSIQNRQGDASGSRPWRLDVSLVTMTWQGILIFIIGILVGLGLFVLYRIVLT